MTYEGSVVAVVVPAYNEAEFIGEVLEGVPEYVDRIYPVDDRSKDRTWDEMTRVASRINDSRSPTPPFEEVVVPTRHEENRGAGAAILTGYRHALADDVDVVATMDGDGQMDPAFLPALFDPIVDGEVAYTKGDRLEGLDQVAEMSRWRLFGNTLLTGLTRVASGYWRLRDPQNGFTAISTDALAALDLDELYERYGFRNDVLVHLSVAGYGIADVSHPAQYGEESSGIRYTSFVPRLSWLLLRRFWWRLGAHSRGHRLRSALAAFTLGVLSLVLVGLSLAGEPFGPSGRSPPTDDSTATVASPRRTDGGVDRSAPARNSRSTGLAASVFFLCAGVLLDVKRRSGRVTRLDGYRD